MPALRNHFNFSPNLKRILAAIILGCSMLASAVAQQPPATPQEKKAALYNAAMGAFNKGDYATAISNYEAILPLAAPDDNLEAVYFYLGASYFNSQDYDKAISTLKTFQTKYPKSARINEVLFCIGQAALLTPDYPGAIDYFKLVEGVPEYHELALYYEGVAFKGADKPDDAIAALENLVSPEIRSATSANGAILLVELYAKKKDFEKASALIKEIRKKLNFVDDMMNLNRQAIELGDGCMEDELPEQALLCYRMVRSHDEVVAFQIEKLRIMNQKIALDTQAIALDPKNGFRYSLEIGQLKAAIIAGTKRLEQYKSEPDIRPSVLLRIGRAFYQMHRPWESIVAFDELVTKYPDATECEPALFAATVSSAEAIRPAATKEYAALYVKKFPDGKHLSAVNYLVGLAAAQANDWQAVADAFSKTLKEQPNNTFKEEMEMQLGNAHFSLGKFDLATKDYQKYLADYPPGSPPGTGDKGVHDEEATYRYALTFIFAGQYEDAMKALNDYLTAYPKGPFVADAKYRLDMCKYAATLYDDVIADCRQWEKDYPKDPLLAEVLALLADSLDAKDKDDEAIQVYIRSGQLATRDETREYAMDSAEKLLQKKGDWDTIAKMYVEFIKDHPDSTLAPKAAFWIARAEVHEGKTDEAKKIIADTINKYIDDPRRDSVEQLLIQLAQISVRKKKPSPSPVVATTGTGATPVPTPVPTPTPAVDTASVDPGAELDQLLGKSEQDSSATAKARILFAKSQLAQMRNQPKEQTKNLQAIADKFKPEDLSSVILGFVGDYLLNKGETDKVPAAIDEAKAYFSYLLDEYPKSDVLDYAYNGLGQIAFDKGDYQLAMRYYGDAIDNGIASGKLKELTIGKARTLLKLERFPDALKTFEEVAGDREWRGILTAESLFSMGDIEQKQGKFADAIAYYQRVYVAYQRYANWVAKAYINSAECFEKLNEPQKAINTYKEMLGNEKLITLPEADVARKRLEALGAK